MGDLPETLLRALDAVPKEATETGGKIEWEDAPDEEVRLPKGFDVDVLTARIDEQNAVIQEHQERRERRQR